MTDEFKGDNQKLISSINALLALDAKGSLVPHGIGEHARVLLQTCVARLPQQHQGEPVALPERKAESVSFFPTGWNACLDEIAKLGPLYTHPAPADAGEVTMGQVFRAAAGPALLPIPDVSIEDSTLPDVTVTGCRFIGTNVYGSQPIQFERGEGLTHKIKAIKLDGWACYGPSAPAYVHDGGNDQCGGPVHPEGYFCSGDGGGEVYTLVPSELSDDQIIEAMRENLNAADGGYVVDTAPDYVVKAGRALLARAALGRKPSDLVAQLQGDLTERDELIDQLRSGYVFETGPYEVELSEAQWSAALGVFENYNMGDDRHFVFLEEQGRGVISEILIEIGVARALDADEVSE